MKMNEMMQCKFCFTELIQDQFGVYCPDETCISIDGRNRDAQEGWNRIENNLCLICGSKEIHHKKVVETATKHFKVSYCHKHASSAAKLVEDNVDIDDEFVWKK